MGDFLNLDEQSEALVFWKPTNFPRSEQGEGLSWYRQITAESTWKILYDLYSSFSLELADWVSFLTLLIFH